MNNRLSKIHPDLQPIARVSPRFLFSVKNLWLIKTVIHWTPAPKTPGDIHIENRSILGLYGNTGIRLRIYRPKTRSAPTPGLIWLHGGGYVMGKPEMDDLRCAQYVRELGISVISVDYRHAPKHPFPSALDDIYAALKWVTAQAEQLGIEGERIGVGGASAGGGLAAALAQLAHDRQEFNLVFQLLVYPMLDDRTVLRTDLDDSDSFTWTQENNRYGWEAYLGKKSGAEDVPAYAVPARRADLSGLPPAWIGVGSLDIFHDEDAAYAQRLKTFGVDCETKIVPGAFHGFDVFDQRIPIVEEFRKSQMEALKKYLFQ